MINWRWLRLRSATVRSLSEAEMNGDMEYGEYKIIQGFLEGGVF